MESFPLESSTFCLFAKARQGWYRPPGTATDTNVVNIELRNAGFGLLRTIQEVFSIVIVQVHVLWLVSSCYISASVILFKTPLINLRISLVTTKNAGMLFCKSSGKTLPTFGLADVEGEERGDSNGHRLCISTTRSRRREGSEIRRKPKSTGADRRISGSIAQFS